MKKRKRDYWRWLYPAHCALCDGILGRRETGLCAACRERVRIRPRAFPGGIAAFPYEGAYREAVQRFKYAGRAEYAAFFAEAVRQAGSGMWAIWRPDVLIPVPVHRNRFRERGYNQAEELARKLGRLLQIPCSPKLVVRRRDTKPQNALEPAERKQNVRGAFDVKKGIVVPRRVLLVDDIRTTGSTLEELTRVLTDHGAETVHAVCICLA